MIKQKVQNTNNNIQSKSAFACFSVLLKFLTTTLLFVFVLFAGQNAFGQNTCTSNSSGDWDDPSIWSCGRVPLSTDDVVIGWNHIITPGTSTNITVNNLNNSGTLTINGSFIVTGTLTINWDKSLTVSGNLTLNSNFTNNGPLQVDGDFIINNSGSLTNADNKLISVGSDMAVTGSVTNNGTLNISGNCDIDGSLTNNDSDQFLVGGNLTVVQGVTNSGTFNVTGSSNITGDLTNNDSDFLYLGTSATIVGNVVNSGTLVSGGDLDITGNITNNNLDLIVVNGNFTKEGDLSSQGYLVVGGDYSSLSGQTLINDTQGDFYVIGVNNCTNSECAEILDFTEWIVPTPGLPYLSSVTAEFDASGTFTVPSGVNTLVVECWGGGGGGGNASHNGNGTSRGGGGAGGSYAAKTITSASGTYSYTVGAGGTGGNNGNASWFGSISTVFAQGGATGASGNKSNATGGSGSIASTIGDLKRPGGDGGNASTSGSGGGGGGAGSNEDGNDAVDNAQGGNATEYGGAGGDGITTTPGYINGNSGLAYGGGGSGSISIGNPGTATTGGSGAQGKVRISFSTLPYVKFDASTTNQTEANTTLTLGISLTSASSSNITLPFSISPASSAAGGGVDYNLNTSSPITITAGNTTASISVSIIQDTQYETDETIIIEFGTPTNAALGSPSSHTLTILNDDTAPTNSLTVSTSSICLGSSVTFTAVPSSGNCDHVTDFYYSPDDINWTPISPETFNLSGGDCISTYTPPATGTLYYRYYFYQNNGHKGYSNSVSVTVNPLPQGSLTANGPFCQPSTGQLTWTATEGTGSFDIEYSDGTNSYTAMDVTSGTPFDVANNPVSSNTTYTLQSVTDANGCTRSSGFSSASATIDFQPISATVTQITPDYECPQLDPILGFDPNNDGPYDAGSSEIQFQIQNNSPTTDWNFTFDVSDANGTTGFLVDSVNATGNSSYNQDILNSNGTFSSIPVADDLITITTRVKNIPGSQLEIDFNVSNITDTNGCSTNYTENRGTVIMNVMPVVGLFE